MDIRTGYRRLDRSFRTMGARGRVPILAVAIVGGVLAGAFVPANDATGVALRGIVVTAVVLSVLVGLTLAAGALRRRAAGGA